MEGKNQQVAADGRVKQDFQGMLLQAQGIHSAAVEHAHQQDEGQNEVQAGAVEYLVAVQLHVCGSGRGGSAGRRGRGHQGAHAEVQDDDAAHCHIQPVQMIDGNIPFQRTFHARNLGLAAYARGYGDKHDGDQGGRKQSNELVR